jgi:hypothetical protein
MNNSRLNFKGQAMQNDDIFVDSEIKSFPELIGMPTRKGMEKAVVSNGKVVNIVSDVYGHLPNEKFFLVVEEKLINADVEYNKRSINRDDRSFAVDYILNDDRYIIDVANGKDIIKPMLRFVNSYDGSCKTSGNFGYFRQVCTNGLHVAETKMSFSVKHKGSICDFVLPEIDMLVSEFMNNEYYTLKPKAEFLSGAIISDVQKFVKQVCNETAIFKYEISDKNPEPRLNATIVADSILAEAKYLNVEPNMWLGYNAFNEILHNKFQKSFDVQRNIDNKLFEYVNELAMAN